MTLFLSKAFKNLDEVYNALVYERSDGTMEKIFVAIEYIKQKDNPFLSVAYLFKEKHRYGVVFQPKVKENLWEAGIEVHVQIRHICH